MSDIDIQLSATDIQEFGNDRGTCGARGFNCRNLTHLRCPVYRKAMVKMLDRYFKQYSENGGGLSEDEIKVLFEKWFSKNAKPEIQLKFLQMQCRGRESAVIPVGDGIPFDKIIANNAEYTIEYDKENRHFVLQPGVYQIDWKVILHDSEDADISLFVAGQPYSAPLREGKSAGGNDILVAGDGAILSVEIINAKGQGARLAADEVQANIRIVKIG